MFINLRCHRLCFLLHAPPWNQSLPSLAHRPVGKQITDLNDTIYEKCVLEETEKEKTSLKNTDIGMSKLQFLRIEYKLVV